MIEAIMIFALGALVATLLALLMLRAVWNRAVRLTTRRVQAQLPLSLDEIKADRDQIRADMAVQTAKAEAEGFQQREKANRFSIDLAKAHETTADLTETLKLREGTIAAQESAITDHLANIDSLTAQLSSERGNHVETRESLAERMHDIARLTDEVEGRTRELAAHSNDIIALKASGDSLAAELQQTAADLTHTRERLGLVQTQLDDTSTLLSRERIDMGELRQQYQDLSERHAEQSAAMQKASAQIFEFQNTIGEQRTALGAAQTRIHTLEMETESRRHALAALDATAKNHAEKAQQLKEELDGKTRTLFAAKTALEKLKIEHDGLLSAHDTLGGTHDALMAELRDTRRELQNETGRRKKAEALHDTLEQARTSDREASLSDKDRFEATIQALSQELELMRAEKNRLNGMLTAARADREALQQAAAHFKAMPQPDTQLRDKIEQLAAELAHITRKIEGDASPINALLKNAGNKAKKPASQRKTLVDRINALEKPLS